MAKREEQIMSTVAFFILLGASFFNPFVMSKLWQWFVTPLGVPAVGYWQCWGLMSLATLVAFRPSKRQTTGEEDLRIAFGRLIVGPLSLFFGWIAYLVMTH